MTEQTIVTARDPHAEIKKPETAERPVTGDIQHGFIKDLGSVTDPVGEIVDLGSMS